MTPLLRGSWIRGVYVYVCLCMCMCMCLCICMLAVCHDSETARFVIHGPVKMMRKSFLKVACFQKFERDS